MLILGFESSCDETAAAVVRDGREICSSVVSSQVETHKLYGGVVPEIASREHLEKIEAVTREALTRAGLSDFGSLGGVAVTIGPGLIGPLLVGVSYAKALAYALGLPIVGVNHIEGHVYSVVFDNPPITYPAMALIVSGGHTNLFHIPQPGLYQVLARTRDDAAGEAFDKVAKMLGLGYPGGPLIERLAREGDPQAARFTVPRMQDGRPDFSFSGLKTAVAKFARERAIEPLLAGAEPTQAMKNLAAGFQHTVVRSLVGTMEDQAKKLLPRTLIVAGGVACNNALREAASEAARSLETPIYFPSAHLSTDNAAMIAAAGAAKLEAGYGGDDLTLNADVSLRLQNYRTDEATPTGKVRYKL